MPASARRTGSASSSRPFGAGRRCSKTKRPWGAPALGASLAHAITHAFAENERKILALLYLFQGFVEVDALWFMGRPDTEFYLEGVQGLSMEQGVALLDRAAEAGLLTTQSLGQYTIHPEMPSCLRGLFNHYYPASFGDADRVRRAFVEAIALLALGYMQQYNRGRRNVMPILIAEEDNLLAAWKLACKHLWWHRIISIMRALQPLYGDTVEVTRGGGW